MTPIQESLMRFKMMPQPIKRAEVIEMLESLLPKEEGFAKKCFQAGLQRQYECENLEYQSAPDVFNFINQLYPEK